MPRRHKRYPELPRSPVSPRALRDQGAQLLDVLAGRLPQMAAEEEKRLPERQRLSGKDVRDFAAANNFTGERMAKLYRDVCREHSPALGILFYGMMKGDVPVGVVGVGLDKPGYNFNPEAVIEGLRKKYPRYQYPEAVGDPFRPAPRGSDPDGYEHS